MQDLVHILTHVSIIDYIIIRLLYFLTVITLMLCNFENILQANKPHYLGIKKL